MSVHALLIGIDAYPVHPLSGCVNDARLMEVLFRDRLRVDSTRARRLLSTAADADGLPTLPRLRFELDRLAGEPVSADDHVFVFYAGHGTRVRANGPAGVAQREALVPLFRAGEPASAQVLFDDELNAALSRIAARARSLTVMLDCCHSAGATRSVVSNPSVRSLELAAGPGGFDAAPAPSSPRAPFVVLAACLADEPAREVRAPNGQQHGVLTYAFCETLKRLADGELEALSWSDLWPALQAEMTARRVNQHPRLQGPIDRAVFSGSPAPRARGFRVTMRDDGLDIEAGTLLGLTPGARLTLDRGGVVEVSAASELRSSGRWVQGGPRTGTARARLDAPGEPEKLAITGKGLPPATVERVKGVRLFRWVAEQADVILVPADGGLAITDDVFGVGPAEPELVRVADAPAGLLEAVLEHYAHFRRVVTAAERVRSALDLGVKLLDSSAPGWPELMRDETGAYALTDRQEFAVRAVNREAVDLFVSLLVAGHSGRVQFLGEALVPAQGSHVFWAGELIGAPFAALATGSGPVTVDRLVAFGTTHRDFDARLFELPNGFREVASRSVRGTREVGVSARAPEGEHWTAERVVLRTRRGPGAP